MDPKRIEVIYENETIKISADTKRTSLEVYKNVAMTMLRQMNNSKKGKSQLKQIVTILQCWEID